MDFLSLITKLTAQGCDVMFMAPTRYEEFELRIRTNTTPAWNMVKVFTREELQDGIILTHILAKMEHQITDKLTELRKTPMPLP